eukprot:6008285-Amphidinium_carterae.1
MVPNAELCCRSATLHINPDNPGSKMSAASDFAARPQAVASTTRITVGAESLHIALNFKKPT